MRTQKPIPFYFDDQPVRTLLINDQPWFVATDVAAALDYRDAHNMCRNLDGDEKGTQIVSTLHGDQHATIINESGLYSAILRSRKAEAKRFKKWVTAEVLPAIRKTGQYQTAEAELVVLPDVQVSQTNLIALISHVEGIHKHWMDLDKGLRALGSPFAPGLIERIRCAHLLVSSFQRNIDDELKLAQS